MVHCYHSDGDVYRLDMQPRQGATPISSLATAAQLRNPAIVNVFQTTQSFNTMTTIRRDMVIEDRDKWNEAPICITPGSWTPEELKGDIMDYQKFSNVTPLPHIFFFFGEP